MRRRSAIAGVLLATGSSLALAHGEELVLYWLTSEVTLLVASILTFLLWREKMRTKLFLFTVLLVAAAATNITPFMPGSLSFMVELGPVGLFALFALVPVVVAGAVYVGMRFISNRRRAQMPPNNAFESGPPSAAAQRER